jgi:hypothetical protein
MVLLKASTGAQFDSNRVKSYQEQLADNIESVELPDEALSKIKEIFLNISLIENAKANRLTKLNLKKTKRTGNLNESYLFEFASFLKPANN